MKARNKIADAARERGLTELEYFQWALKTAGTKRDAARLMGVSPEWFYIRLKALDLKVKPSFEIVAN